jgi:hypothetical protein
MSHDLLDDLLADVPRHVVPDTDAAWRAGTGRRRRRYVAEGVAIAAAVALVGLGLVRLNDSTPVQPINPSKTVDGHPSRVGWPVRQQELADRPGPMAGVVAWSADEDQGYVVVDSRGRISQVPDARDFEPTLSDDGRWLAYLRDDGRGESTFVLHDLVSGDERTVPDVGAEQGGEPWVLDSHAASFWSRDDRALVVRAQARQGGRYHSLLLTNDGQVIDLGERRFAAGWHGSDRLVFYTGGGLVRIVDTAGQVVDEVQLERGRRDWPFPGSAGQVSPDGARLALLDGTGQVLTFSLTTGLLESSRTVEASASDAIVTGPPVWRGDDVWVTYDRGLSGPSGATTQITFGDHWPGITRIRWAGDAIAGPDRGGPGLLDWRYWWFLSWWPQALIVLGVVLVGGLVWWLDARDRRKLARRT